MHPGQVESMLTVKHLMFFRCSRMLDEQGGAKSPPAAADSQQPSQKGGSVCPFGKVHLSLSKLGLVSKLAHSFFIKRILS